MAFETIGVVLEGYSVLIELCKAVAASQGMRLLVDDLKGEELRYTESLGHLFGTDFVNVLAHQEYANSLISYSPQRQQANFERRLGKPRAELIYSTLEGMSEVLESMQRDIEKISAGHSFEFGSYEKVYRSLRQFKFIRRQSSFRDRLLQLKKSNDRLKTHLDYQQISTSRELPLISFPRQLAYVNDIYDAIHSGYQCYCGIPHSTRFGLPDVFVSTGYQAPINEGKNSFKLLFPSEDYSENSTINSPISASTMEDFTQMDYRMSSRRLSITSSTATLALTSTSSSSRSRVPRSRCLAIEECSDAGTCSIDNLCATVRELDDPALKEQDSIGIISSSSRKYELRRAIEQPDSSSFEETIDLDELLTSYQDIMLRNYRFDLALRLSYAVLQFYCTPWITPNWRWKDFSIAMGGARPQKGDQLFINHNFYSTRRRSTKSETHLRSFAFWAGVGEETLTRLGFALIEIGLGRRLSELRQDGSLQPDPRMMMTMDVDILDFWTAEGVLDCGLLFDEHGQDYEDIVRVLIKHQFEENCEKKILSSRKPSFYGDVERLVLTPLWYLWTDSWGRRTSQLSF